MFSIPFLEHGVGDFLQRMTGFIFDDLVAIEEVIKRIDKETVDWGVFLERGYYQQRLDFESVDGLI